MPRQGVLFRACDQQPNCYEHQLVMDKRSERAAPHSHLSHPHLRCAGLMVKALDVVAKIEGHCDLEKERERKHTHEREGGRKRKRNVEM